MIDDNLVKVVTVVAPVVLAVVVYLTGRQAKRSADQAAVAVRRVETTLVQTTSDTIQQLGEIHVLVNRRLHEALDKIDRLEQRLYELTGDAPLGGSHGQDPLKE